VQAGNGTNGALDTWQEHTSFSFDLPTAYGSRKSPRRIAPRRFMYGDLRAHISRGGGDAIVVCCSAHHCTLALTCTRVGVRTADQLSASCAARFDQSVTRIAARRGARRALRPSAFPRNANLQAPVRSVPRHGRNAFAFASSVICRERTTIIS